MKSLILVVDDDADVRATDVAILKDAGYPVLEAAHARDAILLLEENPSVVLLFTDINMPDINGYVLADMAVTHWPHLRILYTTGGLRNDRASSEPGSLHGEVLIKPYRPAQLIAAIAASLMLPRPSRNGWGQRPTLAQRLVNEESLKIVPLPFDPYALRARASD